MNGLRYHLTFSPLGALAVIAAAAAVGVGIGVSPLMAAGLVGALLVVTLTVLWPSWGLLLVLATVAVGQTVRLPLFGEETAVLPGDALLPLVAIGWAIRRLTRREPMFPARPLGRPLLIVIGVFILSLLAAVLREEFTSRELAVAALYILRWVEYLMVFFIARTVVRSGLLRRWVRVFGLLVLALAALGFLQVIFFPDFSSFVPQGWDPHVGRLLSTWYDPNFLAGFFAFAILVFAALLGDKTPDRRLALVVVSVGLLALVLTFSRSGYAGFVIGFGVLALLRTRHFIALGALAVLLVFLLVPRVQERVIGIRSVDETAQLRIKSWENALTVVRDYPWLGVGYNSYRYVQVRYGFLDDPAEHAAGGSDSSFLTLGVTTGVVGMVAYLVLLAAMLKAAWDTARRAVDPTLRAAGYGVLAGLIALIVHGQFVNGLLYPHLMETHWFMLGALLGARDREAGV